MSSLQAKFVALKIVFLKYIYGAYNACNVKHE